MNVFSLSDKIIEGYTEYLKNSLVIQDSELSKLFKDKIEREMWSKGPYVEIIPNFKSGASISEAVDKGLLNPVFKDLFNNGYMNCKNADSFKLYEHQEASLKKVKNNRNIIISSGTSSGKTECYLFPIISYLLDEYQRTKAPVKGLRAILIFPMNVLANDQYDRFKEIFENIYNVLGTMPFSYGKYTGETEETEVLAAGSMRGVANKGQGEMISREEMRESTPNILFTNYSMLEYLLLRPVDNNIITSETAGKCKFCVLDEIHVYPGAKGVEVSYLLRRLVHRIKNKCNKLNIEMNKIYSDLSSMDVIPNLDRTDDDMIFIGTSATLARNESNFKNLSIFASQIFDSPVLYNEDPSLSDIIQSTMISNYVYDNENENENPNHYSLIEMGLKSLMENVINKMDEKDMVDNEHVTSIINDVVFIFKIIPLNNLIFQESLKTKISNHDDYLAYIDEICKNHIDSVSGNDEDKESELLFKLANLFFIIFYNEKNIRSLYKFMRKEIVNKSDIGGSKELTIQDKKLKDNIEFYLNCLKCVNFASYEKRNLFKTRLHLYFRTPAGFFTTLEDTNFISFERINEYEDKNSGKKYPCFETVFCRNCGQRYIKANLMTYEGDNSKRLSNFIEYTNESLEILMVSDSFINDSQNRQSSQAHRISSDEEDEESDDILKEFKDKNGIDPITTYYYHNAEEKLFEKLEDIPNGVRVIQLEHFNFKEDAAFDKNLRVCYRCNYASESIVNPFRLAPEDPIHNLNLLLFRNIRPMERKLLAFSDNIQKAAFYAAYLQRKSDEKFLRNYFLKKLNDPTWCSMIRLKNLVIEQIPRNFIDDIPLAGDNNWVSGFVNKHLISEFTNIESRENLEGLGLWKFDFNFPEHWKLTDKSRKEVESLNIPRLSQLKDNEFMDLIKVLIYLSRKDFSFTLGDILLNDLIKPYEKMDDTLSYSPNFSHQGLSKWEKKKVKNFSKATLIRGRFIKKMFKKLKIETDDEKIQNFLDIIFEEIKSNTRLFVRIDTAKYKLNLNIFNVYKISDDDVVFQCTKCKKVCHINLFNMCLEDRCNGSTMWVKQNALKINDFLKEFYLTDNLTYVNVHEHTGQLSKKGAKDIQDRFKRNEINVISSTTTFEVGVDIGNLNFELLKNIPPTPANYIQRVGRIGRGRTSSGSLALIFCNVNNHDQFFFRDPMKMIAGEIQTIPLNIMNEYIARRHVNSEIIAKFWKTKPSIKKIEDFYDFSIDINQNQPIAPDFEKYVRSNVPMLTNHINSIFPDDIIEILDLSNLSYDEHFLNESRFPHFKLAFSDLKREIDDLSELENKNREKTINEKASKELKKLWTDINYLERKIAQIKKKELIEILSRYNIIPKYGFPVDTVELKVRSDVDEEKIELTRDLSIAILEYAPGSEVICDKREFKSHSVIKPANNVFETYDYCFCKDCGFFVEKPEIPERTMTCLCGKQKRVYKYLVPRHGFTTVKNFEAKPALLSQLRSVYSITPFIIFENEDSSDALVGGLDRIYSSQSGDIRLSFVQPEKAKIIIISRGKKNKVYFICEECGYVQVTDSKIDPDEDDEEPPKKGKMKLSMLTKYRKKTTPKAHLKWTRFPCNSELQRIDFGYSFYTSVLTVKLEIEEDLVQFIYRKLEITKLFDRNLVRQNQKYHFIDYSFMYALIYYISHFLNIPKNEIAILVKSRIQDGSTRKIEMTIYDNVPGGAGYVDRISKLFEIRESQLNEETIDFFTKMKKNYEECDCKIDTSCYRCLRSRINHEYHEFLRRDVIIEILKDLLNLNE